MILSFRKVIMFAFQVDESMGPFCPPDTALIGNNSYTFSSADSARKAYIDNMLLDENRHKRRLYWDGALYRNLFSGYYDTIYSERGEVIINVTQDGINGKSQRQTRVLWTVANDSNNIRLPILRDWCVRNIKSGLGNCRHYTRDQGTMVIMGWRRTDYTAYASNLRVENLKETMTLATHHFRELFPQQVLEISIRSLPVRNNVPGLEYSAVSELIVSKDLVNACHIDFKDESYSVTTWLETKPGGTKSKYFMLPFTSKDGIKSLVFPIVDGQSIAWDGRILKHCSSAGVVAPDNSVYGLFLGSK